MTKITRLVKNGKIYFIKWQEEEQMGSGRVFKRGVCTFVQREWGGKTYEVYRSQISKRENEYDFGNGWNLFKNLNKKKAVAAARKSLRYL